MGQSSRYSPEVRERAIRLVRSTPENGKYSSQGAAIDSTAAKIGCTGEALRSWVLQAQRGQGLKPGLISDERIVPRESVIGGYKIIGSGFKTAMRIMDKGRLFIAAHALDGAQRCLELATEYAKTREQFGQPIGNFQMIQAMLAEMEPDVVFAPAAD